MLNKKDQKIIRQMMRHIRTFPLLDSEIRQFERDLTGMALEAEKLNFPIFDDCDSFGTGIGRGNSSICCNNRSDILWGIFIIWKYRRTQLWRNRKICTARE